MAMAVEETGMLPQFSMVLLHWGRNKMDGILKNFKYDF